MAFLVAARLIGQKVVVTIHHVIAPKDLTMEVLRGLGLSQPVRTARVLIRVSTALLCRVAHRVIVLDEVFRQRLAAEYGVHPARVETLPYGVFDPGKKLPAPAVDRRILLFGYLKWYKGIDIALRAFRELASEFPGWKLIIAGGLPPDLEENHPYKRFLADLRVLAHPLGSQVEFTGYVDDDAIPSLFWQADIVLFPYRVLFATSGPLALAICFRRPFILSAALRPLLPTWPLWCPNSPLDWAEAMRLLMQDEGVRHHAMDLVEVLASDRAWPKIAAQTVAIYREVNPLMAASGHSA
jgi:glycosyltransferase involved in cell wall biosynthesis